MPGPYSMDLRERVVRAYLEGEGTYEAVAVRFAIGEATVDRWVSRFRNRGSVAADAMGGNRNGKFDEEAEQRVRELVEVDPGVTRVELVRALDEHLELQVSPAAVQRALVRLKLTRKKRRSTPLN